MWFNRKYFKTSDTLFKENGKKNNAYPTIGEAKLWASNNEQTIQVVRLRIDEANRAGNWDTIIDGFDTEEEVKNLAVLLLDVGITARPCRDNPKQLYCNWELEEAEDEEDYSE